MNIFQFYKKAYDLTLYFEQVVRNFGRYHKYTLGTELRTLSREVLRLIGAPTMQKTKRRACCKIGSGSKI